MKLFNIIMPLSLSICLYAEQSDVNVDCLTLIDENSIICKYTQTRVDFEKTLTFNWIDPNGVTSRSREMFLPAHHGSVYDYRYLSGRLHGIWEFQVIDGENIYKTNFTID